LGDLFENNFAQIIWAIYFRNKTRPSGEISPNLATLVAKDS
jgi:hypothetical protein